MNRIPSFAGRDSNWLLEYSPEPAKPSCWSTTHRPIRNAICSEHTATEAIKSGSVVDITADDRQETEDDEDNADDEMVAISC